MSKELIAKLRYQGRQYAAGQQARGGTQQKHYLEEAADRIEELEAQLDAAPAPTGQAQPATGTLQLSDDEIVKALDSLGVDTYPSVYGFSALQVSATSVPTIRNIVNACIAAQPAPARDAAIDPHHRAMLEAEEWNKTPDQLKLLQELFDRAVAIRAPVSQPVQAVTLTDWQPMLTAPLDGTEVELIIRHNNWIYASAKDREQWEQIVSARWIDFNGGGWTWHGMAGMPVGWRLLSGSAKTAGGGE